MKKIFLTLGATASIVAPIAAVVACDNNDEKKEVVTPTKSNNEFADFKLHTPWYGDFKESDIKAGNFKVPTDGIYLVKEAYNGRLGEGFGNAWKEVNKNVSYMWGGSINDSVTELGNNDSLYVLFDEDQNDGLIADDFEKEFFFNDSSLMIDQGVKEVNESLGLKANPFYQPGRWTEMEMLIPFANGKSSSWLGTQSNHISKTFDEAMATLKTEATADQYAKVEAYYTSHSKVFKPMIMPEGTFTYERVSKNAYKVTYHFDETNPKYVTAAGFKLINKDKNINDRIWTVSMGDSKEWNAYESQGSNYKFLGRK